MEQIKSYFDKNKNEILNFINNEQNVYPKLFILKTNDIFDNNFYYSLKEKNNIFNYFFSFNNFNIFNILYIKENYSYRSDITYKNMFLFFSVDHEIFLNNKKQKDIFIVNSSDSVFIKNGVFLKISFTEEDFYNYENISIHYREKNIFDHSFIKKINFKKFLKNHF